jgi:hypothetical protein
MASLLADCFKSPADKMYSGSPGVLPIHRLCSMSAMVCVSYQMIQGELSTAFHSRTGYGPTYNKSVLQCLVPQMCQLLQAYCMQLSSSLGWLQLALKVTRGQGCTVQRSGANHELLGINCVCGTTSSNCGSKQTGCWLAQ